MGYVHVGGDVGAVRAAACGGVGVRAVVRGEERGARQVRPFFLESGCQLFEGQ